MSLPDGSIPPLIERPVMTLTLVDLFLIAAIGWIIKNFD